MEEPSCPACKTLHRMCTSDCTFALYFPTQYAQEDFFALHRVFDASNVSKLLQEIQPEMRQETVLFLVYAAKCHLQDPTCHPLNYQQLKLLLQQQSVLLEDDPQLVQLHQQNTEPLNGSQLLQQDSLLLDDPRQNMLPLNDPISAQEDLEKQLMELNNEHNRILGTKRPMSLLQSKQLVKKSKQQHTWGETGDSYNRIGSSTTSGNSSNRQQFELPSNDHGKGVAMEIDDEEDPFVDW